jgi:hypothetical protein
VSNVVRDEWIDAQPTILARAFRQGAPPGSWPAFGTFDDEI